MNMSVRKMVRSIFDRTLDTLRFRNRNRHNNKSEYDVLKARNRSLADDQERDQSSYNQAMPVHLFVETTMKCNLRCTMCLCTHNVKNPMAQPTMDIALFKKIAEEAFPPLDKVSLSIAGEPLLSEHLDEEIETITKYHVKLEMNTNATLLHKDETIDKLLGALSHISVSFDGATKETYESIRRGAKYTRVTANIRRLNERRNLLPKGIRPTMDLTCVLMRSNIEELPRFVVLAKELGADSISAAHVVINDTSMKNESLIYHKELANHYLIEAREKAAALGIPVSWLPPLFELSDISRATTKKHKNHSDRQPTKVKTVIKCPFLWKKCYISFGGDVTPCCVPGRPVMGNVTNRSFRDIWNGEIYQAMRSRLNSDSPFECCKHCSQLERAVLHADEEAFIKA